jgi:hypothetical protein
MILVAMSACGANSSATPSTCSRDEVIATAKHTVTYLFACSGTILVPEATLSVSVGQTVRLTGPGMGRARLALAATAGGVTLREQELTAVAPGNALVNVSGLPCGPVDGSQPAVCPLLRVHVS